MQRADRQRQAERVGVLLREPPAQEHTADQSRYGGGDPGDEPVAEVVTAQGARPDAVRGERADDGALRSDEPRQEDERAQHGRDEEQERQQVRELAEGLDVLVQGDERRLVRAGLDDQTVVAGQRGGGRHERRCLAAVDRVQRQLLFRCGRQGLANDAGANTTPNWAALVITSCCERAGQKYSVASPLPETRTGCQPDGPNSSIVLPGFKAK